MFGKCWGSAINQWHSNEKYPISRIVRLAESNQVNTRNEKSESDSWLSEFVKRPWISFQPLQAASRARRMVHISRSIFDGVVGLDKDRSFPAVATEGQGEPTDCDNQSGGAQSVEAQAGRCVQSRSDDPGLSLFGRWIDFGLWNSSDLRWEIP